MARKSLRRVSGAVCGVFAAAFLTAFAAAAAPDQTQEMTNGATANGTAANGENGQDTGAGNDNGDATDQSGQAPGAPGAPGAQAAAQTPPFLFNGNVGVSETYLTNVDGTANGSGTTGDFDSRLQLTLNALAHGSELTAAVSYNGQLDEFARSNSSPVVNTNLTGLFDYRVIPGYLQFDARAFATPVLINPLGPLTAPSGTLPQGANANISDTYGYSVAPTLDFRFGNFATSELTPSYGTAYFVTPAGAPPISGVLQGTTPPPEVSTASVIEKITSGDDFSRFYWQLLGSDMQQSDSALGLKQRQGTADIEYAISREFILLASGGYQTFDSDTALSQNLDGPIYYGGLRLKFSELSHIEVRVGEEYHTTSYTGDLSMALSSTTGITGYLEDFVQTPAGRLLGGLSNLDLNTDNSASTGAFQFYNGSSVVAGQSPLDQSTFNATPSGNFGFDNVIERFRDAQITLNHKFVNTEVSLNGFGTIGTILSAVPVGEDARQTTWGATLQVERNLASNFSVSGYATYDDQSIAASGKDQYVTLSASANYSLSRTLSVYAQASYSSRLSGASLSAALPASGNANVTSVTIGIQKSF